MLRMMVKKTNKQDSQFLTVTFYLQVLSLQAQLQEIKKGPCKSDYTTLPFFQLV